MLLISYLTLYVSSWGFMASCCLGGKRIPFLKLETCHKKASSRNRTLWLPTFNEPFIALYLAFHCGSLKLRDSNSIEEDNLERVGHFLLRITDDGEMVTVGDLVQS